MATKAIISNAATKNLAPGYALTKNATTPVGIANNPTAAAAWNKMTVQQQQAFLGKQSSADKAKIGVPGYLTNNPLAPVSVNTSPLATRTNINYGDVGNNIGNRYINTIPGITTSTGETLRKGQTTPYDTAYSKFGQEAKILQAKDPMFLARRNDYLATDLAKKGLTDEASIRNELSKNKGFLTSQDWEKQNTIEAIQKRIAEQGVAPELTTPSATADWDKVLNDIAKAQGFKSADDLKTKTGNDYTDFGQTYYKALATGDQNQIDAFTTMLNQQVGKNKQLTGIQGQETGTEAALLSFYKDNAPQVFQDKSTVTNLLKEGYKADQIAGFLGKDAKYVNDLINNDISSYTSLTPEKQQELLKYNTMDQQKALMDEQQALRDRQLGLERAKQDYQTEYARQQEANDTMAKNMSVLARLTGAGYSSLGLEGFEHTVIQGQNALNDLTKNYDRYTTDQQNAISDITNGYNYNIKLYNMQADDMVKNAKNGFFNSFQGIKAQYGDLSDKTMQEMNNLASDYIKQVQTINQWRTENMQKQTDQLRQRAMDIQKINAEANKPQKIGTDELGNDIYGIYDTATNSFKPVTTPTTTTIFQPAGQLSTITIPTAHEGGIKATVDSSAAQPLSTAFAEMAKAGLKPEVNQAEGTYRTVAQQGALYDKLHGTGAVAEAGKSMHNKGLAVDISNVSPEMATIMNNNGWYQPEGLKADSGHFEFKGTQPQQETQFTPAQIAWYNGGVANIKKGKLTEAQYNEIDQAASNGLLPPTKEQKDATQSIYDKLVDLEKTSGFEGAVGASIQKMLPGWLKPGEGNFVPGTPAASFASKFNTLISTQVLPNLGLLKGPMSDKDVAFLKSTASSLNLDMDETTFKKTLQDMKDKLIEKGAKPSKEDEQSTTQYKEGGVYNVNGKSYIYKGGKRYLNQ